jgi:hypothetical protein
MGGYIWHNTRPEIEISQLELLLSHYDVKSPEDYDALISLTRNGM